MNIFGILLILFCKLAAAEPSSGNELYWFNLGSGWCLTNGAAEFCLAPDFKMQQVSDGYVEIERQHDTENPVIVKFHSEGSIRSLSDAFPSTHYALRSSGEVDCISWWKFEFVDEQLGNSGIHIYAVTFGSGPRLVLQSSDKDRVDTLLTTIVDASLCRQ